MKRRLHTRHLQSRTSFHNLISLHKQKSSVPIKFPFPYSPMIFPPHTCYLALVRVVKNKKIREKFSCLAIFLSVTMVVRLSRNCATQILNFVGCSDWFSRNYHAPATRQKILPSPRGNKCHTGLHAGYHLSLLGTTNHVNVYMSIKRFSLRQGREFPSLFFLFVFSLQFFVFSHAAQCVYIYIYIWFNYL